MSLAVPALLISGLAVLASADAGLATTVLATTVLATTGAPVPASSGAAVPAAGQPAHPVDPTVRSYAVRGVSATALQTLGDTKAAHSHNLAALSAPRPATGFAVTGVTWRGTAPPGLSLAVRTRTGGHWSGWTPMEYDKEHGPSAGSGEAKNARPGTDPFVVGAVDDVQLRVLSDSGRAPTGLTLDVVDPGTSTEDASPEPITPDEAAEISAPSLPAASAPSPTTITAPDGATASAEKTTSATNTQVTTRPATPMPTIYSRADWGADERLRDCCVEYGEVHAGFVHHTVNANGYSRAEVPAILRGIYAYHTQSRGWRDIGYNYLIDRFGQIWEGRYGGITLPVVGAHTLNYNENSFAASAIGNYDVARPSSAMIDAYARLYAWKLSLHGIRPTSRQNVAGTAFNAINGHRDAAQTACPGRYLYAKIPAIIAKAKNYQHLFLGRAMQHSFMRDKRPDVLLVGARGGVSVSKGTGPPGFGAPVSAPSPGFSGADLVAPVRDVTGDRVPDLMARDASTGRTAVYPGLKTGGVGTASHLVGKWANADLFAGVGDLTGDGNNDVIARSETTGELRVYPGRGDGTFARARVAIAAATGFDLVAGAGDFDGDGFADIVTRGVHGAVFVWFGNGKGGFPRNLRVAHDWSGRDAISGGVDLTGDRRPDLVARNAKTHVVSTYANIDGHALSPAIGHRKSSARYLAVSPDLTGDSRPDVLALSRTSTLTAYPGSRANWLRPPTSRPYSWTGTDKVLVVGDWDRDGYVDVMARRASDATMRLYRGTSQGGFEAPVGSWPGWGNRRQITPVGDFNGDGFADLMAQTSRGAVYLYPGRGLRGFRSPILMRSSLPQGSTIVGVGLWTHDGAPDVVVRDGQGRMLLYPGNGPGGLDDPSVIGTGYRAYRTLVGVGDLTGDGAPDLIGRRADGQAWLIPGRPISSKAPRGGFGSPQYLASDWSRYFVG